MFANSLMGFILVLVSTVSAVKTIDHKNLLEQYISVCGMKLCNSSMFGIKPEMDYNSSSNCPNCMCDTGCWLNNNCCPDLYLSFPVFNEVNTNVFSSTNSSTEDEYHRMIATCPNEPHDCEVGPTLSDLLNNVPVFAGPYNLSFRSVCYAHCNGYNVTRNWYLDIDCDTFYDLNYCSTFQEISTTLNKAKCNVRYAQDIVRNNRPTTDAVIETCNVTGFWNNYDAEVVKLCAYLGPEMGRYSHTHSNVFCYICNPSEAFSADVISTCNVTGKWRVLDQGLRDACEHYPFAHSEQPYKNYFCRMCNQNNLDPSTIGLLDGTIKLKYETVADWKLKPSQQYDVTVQDVDIETIVNSYKQQRGNKTKVALKSKIETILENDGEIDVDGTTVNITNLLFNVYLRTGSYDICASSLLNVGFTNRSNNCSCDVSCIFSDIDVCCPDVRLLTQTKCIDEFGLSTTPTGVQANKWLAIGECPADYTDDVIVYLCHNDDADSASQLVPVESTVSRIVFKNIYCAICHLNKDMGDSYELFMTKVQFYSLRLVCPLPIPFQNEISLGHIISRATTGRCTIQYIPVNLTFTCDKEGAITGQCNEHNLWEKNDPDVKWACENTDLFPPFDVSKNIFCDICNPSIVMPVFFRSCNKSKMWRDHDNALEVACSSYPAIQKTSPYKNGLCKRCNDPKWSIRFKKNSMAVGTVNACYDLKRHTDPKITLRSFFTTYDDQPSDDEVVRVRCQRYQMYDAWKSKCRDVKCNPGRHLYTNACNPLLQTTTNLSYSLSLSLQGHINHTGAYVTGLLDGIGIHVHSYLAQTLNVNLGHITVSSFLAMSHIGCPNRSTIIQHGTHLDLFISTEFDIHTEFINRFETEKLLVELPGKTMDVRYLNKVIPFIMSEHPKAFSLPILIKKTSLDHQCYIKQTSSSQFNPHRSFRRSQVSELLQCRQVYLDTDEYLIDEDGMTLTFAGSDLVVKYPEFELISNGQVRICESELPSMARVESVENIYEDALRIFTLVFVCISLLCLLITFRPYYKFAYLRTLPGLNTVGLMVSLFFVQLMFVIHTFTSTENVTACTILGILLHVFWLVYFAWTGVGTFHMYRVFVSDDYVTDDERRYTSFRRYATFTVLFALSVVVLNIGLTAAITEGSSIGYGGTGCFMSSIPGKVVSFIVPVIFICIWNTLFFVVTYRYIRDASFECKKVIKDESVAKDDRFSLGIFSKLFILSGLTWIFQIIDGFFPLSPFSFIVTFVNASQGVLILYLNHKNLKRKNRRRPGSTCRYTGSPSNGHRRTTQHSTSVVYSRSSFNTVSGTFQNEGFDSVGDGRIPPRMSVRRFSDVSLTSTSRIIDNAESIAECDSIGEDTADFDSVGNDSAVIDCIGEDTADFDSIGNDSAAIDCIGEDTAVIDSIGNNRAAIDSIGEDTAVIDSIGDKRAAIDSIGEDTAVIDSIGDNRAAIDSIGSNRPASVSNDYGDSVKYHIGDENADCDSVDNGRAECDYILDEGDVSVTIPCQDHSEV